MSDDPPIFKRGPDVHLSEEMLTVDRFLENPSRLHLASSERTISGFIERYVFGYPWERPDTWRGWPREFVLFARLLDLTARLKLGRQTVAYRALHAFAALRGRDDHCPESEEW